MPPYPQVPPALSDAPFRGSVAVRAGLITFTRLRSSCWRRLLPDVYAHAGLPDGPLLRARSAALVLPPGAAVSGQSAAWLYGVDILPGTMPLVVTLPPGRARRSHPALLVRQALLSASDIALLNGVTVTAPLRTAFDLARDGDEVTAVVAIDALLHAGPVTAGQLADYASAHPGSRGVRQVARRLALAEPATESPMETRLRLLLIAAGLPRPVSQLTVRDRHGGFVARLDLAYPTARLGIEYDGGAHREAAMWRADLRRQNALRAAGWTLLRYTGPDVFHRGDRVARQVRLVLAAAA